MPVKTWVVGSSRRWSAVLGPTLAMLVVLMASACASRPNLADTQYDFQQKTPLKACNQGLKDNTPRSFQDEELCLRLTVPKVGLALSGGGSKSAPFAIGVMAGLEESGVLSHVDIVSSVSGGSYAALYYYSRLLSGYNDDAVTHYDTEEIFWDCLPQNRALYFASSAADPLPSWSRSTHTGFCPTGSVPGSVPGSKKPYVGRYWPLAGEVGDADYGKDDPLRQASLLRGYADLMTSQWSYGDNVGSLHLTWKLGGKWAEQIAMNSVVLGIPNFIANSLFDWRANLSWTKGTYDEGITRTYGRDAIALQWPKDANAPRALGDPESVGRLRFSELKNLYNHQRSPDCLNADHGTELCTAPFWIINATAGTNMSSLRIVDFDKHPYNAPANGFEFTAFGYGSGAFGWYKWGDRELDPLMSIQDAVGMSGAFLDSQQRQKGGFFRPLVNLWLHTSNFDWGTDLPNYHQSQSEYRGRREVHWFLPWPFYLLHHQRADTHSIYIHVSDGGQTENLGVYPLLRRHVQDIIVVDGGEDTDYNLEDFCVLGKQAHDNDGYTLFIDGVDHALTTDWKPCGHSKNPFKIRDAVSAPVLRGVVCKGDATRCSDDNAAARLFIIKAALNMTGKPASGISLNDAKKLAVAHSLAYSQCHWNEGAPDPGYPCEVVTYLADPSTPRFPQDYTVTVTLTSNAYIFGAYKELGRYYANHLLMNDESGVRALKTVNPWVVP